MSDVFVSYASKDREAARIVVDALGRAGLSVSDDHALAEGADLTHQLETEFAAARCVVIVWSAAAAQSRWVQKEMRQVVKAWSSEQLVLAALDETPLPTGLGDIPPIRLGKDPANLVGRVREVVSAAGRRAAQPSVPPGAAPPVAARAAGLRAGLLTGLAALVIVGALAFGWGVLNKSAAPPPDKAAAPQFHTESLPRHGPLQPKAQAPAPEPAPTAEAALEQQAPLVIGLLAGAVAGAGAVWLFVRRGRRRPSPASVADLPREAPPGGGLQVFVSYSHKDGSAVEDLVQKLEAMGYPVWIDREAAGAQRYAGSIVGAIRTSKLVALMCSRSAFASDHVIREIYVAGDFKKPFIAFQLDPTEFPDEVLYFLTGFPRIPVDGVTQDQLRAEIARAARDR